jgi:putative hemolysin
MTHLRLATYCLDRGYGQEQRWRPVWSRQRLSVPVAAPLAVSALAREVAALPAEHCLVPAEEFAVYLAPAAQIPAILQEIGRLRELTFRAVKEGSGNAVDLDRFDPYYEHLFVWNTRRAEVVGAYRLGRTDVICQQHGPHGLYTSTLFRFKPAVLRHLANAIELGRAFVRAEYQRQYGCLWLLWRGIAAFLVRHRQYTRLFGPVSISQDYHEVSKNILIQFLRDHRLHAELARYVSPRSPYRGRRLLRPELQALCASLHSLDDVSWLIAAVDDGKDIPVLLRYYLGLGATLLGFNRDKHFANVIDGLILVDVTRTDPRLLRRVMGQEGFALYTAHHGSTLPTAV